MTYSGDVRPGGPSDVRVLDEVEIRKASVGPMDNNAYLVTCRRTGAQLLVDAAADPERLLALVREGAASARLDGIVTTHRHPDHLSALASVVAVTGAPLLAGAPDADAVAAAADRPVQRRLQDGDTIAVGHAVLEVIALRGHTPGSIALVYREPEHADEADAVAGRAHLFTGDSLFPGGVGATGNDRARFDQLFLDVTERIFDRFDDTAWVYPGHGPDTTLGAERPQLDAWRARGW
ncbi:MAG: Zn-dependent hydrolase [Cellulomonas sp. 73-145]|uniref:MBL fold metallo-hydrolase n=1 Tax=Cellulomonas sp. 73-145 TaxID=1895739 RepID=UPI0009272B77|nr:MBL fold metallo-hydrolase [Cellulomonas sp. 73-145]MBN9327895.1 MBL fold metallo-hydrolase [Cellulomonas sp.]OJV60946.1 MAG: Zn-dependent hydrolase [Cellulomonas sp. 73-145]